MEEAHIIEDRKQSYKVKREADWRHVYHVSLQERKHNGKVWREKDKKEGGMRVRKKKQILSTAHRNNQSLSPGHTNIHAFVLASTQRPCSLDPYSLILLMFSPTLKAFPLPDTAGLFLCTSTKDITTHKCIVLTKSGF